MAGESQGSAPEIPEIKRPDVQLMLQDLAQARRDLYEERRHGEKRVFEERERSRWELERVRTELTTKMSDIDRQNDALIRSLGRLQADNDRLREEVASLRLTRANGHTEPKVAEKSQENQTVMSLYPTAGLTSLAATPKIQLVPSLEPPLGKPIPVPESKP